MTKTTAARADDALRAPSLPNIKTAAIVVLGALAREAEELIDVGAPSADELRGLATRLAWWAQLLQQLAALLPPR